MNPVEYFIVITNWIFHPKLAPKTGMLKALISKRHIKRLIFRYSAHISYSRASPSRSSFDLSCADELSKSETVAVRSLILYIYIIQSQDICHKIVKKCISRKTQRK